MAFYVIVGGSRGIGGSATKHFVDQGHTVIAVSRTPAVAGTWVQADIGTEAGIERVVAAVTQALADWPDQVGLDGLLFLGGIWEHGAFTDDYDFMSVPVAETHSLMSVNLIAPILLSQSLAPDLAKAKNPRIILNGSQSGLPNEGGPEVANTATKFGLQGSAEALNISLRRFGIGVTVVNFGNVETPEVLEDIEQGLFEKQTPIPIADLLFTYDYLLTISADTVPQSVDLRQKYPAGVTS